MGPYRQYDIQFSNTYCTAPRAGKTRGKHLAFYIHIGWLPQQPASLSWHQVNRWPNTHLLRPRFGKRGIKLKVLSMNVSERIARALEVDSVPPRENSQATAAHVTCNSCRFLQPAARSLPCAVFYSSYTELQQSGLPCPCSSPKYPCPKMSAPSIQAAGGTQINTEGQPAWRAACPRAQEGSCQHMARATLPLCSPKVFLEGRTMRWAQVQLGSLVPLARGWTLL